MRSSSLTASRQVHVQPRAVGECERQDRPLELAGRRQPGAAMAKSNDTDAMATRANPGGEVPAVASVLQHSSDAGGPTPQQAPTRRSACVHRWGFGPRVEPAGPQCTCCIVCGCCTAGYPAGCHSLRPGRPGDLSHRRCRRWGPTPIIEREGDLAHRQMARPHFGWTSHRGRWGPVVVCTNGDLTLWHVTRPHFGWTSHCCRQGGPSWSGSVAGPAVSRNWDNRQLVTISEQGAYAS